MRIHQLFDALVGVENGPSDQTVSGKGDAPVNVCLYSLPRRPDEAPVSSVRAVERPTSRTISAAAIVTIAR